jgi:Zn-dependent M28 family amino/carboxypeptidase
MIDFFYHSSPRKELPPLTPAEHRLQAELRQRVQRLAGVIGERNARRPTALLEAVTYLETVWGKAGFEVHSQEYFVDHDLFSNLWVEVPGLTEAESILVVGAHYDTVPGTPGADDNGTAVAALISLSLQARHWKPQKTIRFVAFANEEPPYFMTPHMGSYAYAQRCKLQGDKIDGMVCLEMLGYFSKESGSQQNRHGMLPDVGDFIGLVGNVESEGLIRQAADAFESEVGFPMQAAAVPLDMVPEAAFSDHWSFWQFGWPAFMVTDTGPLRNPHYHLPSDTPDTIDYESYTRVVVGVQGVIKSLAGQLN